MSDEQTRQVLELAQQRIESRKTQEYQQVVHTQEARFERERPWLYALVGLVGALVVALLLTPGIPLPQKLLLVMQGVCSQDHNLYLAGWQLPICARCTGIYTTAITGVALLWGVGRGRAGGLPPWHIGAALVGFVMIMGFDGINSVLDTVGAPTFYTPHNVLRTVTGMGMGLAVAVLVMLLFNQTLRRDVQGEQPVLRNWLEVGGILLLNFLLLAAVFGNLHLLYWPLAIASMLGMIGTLYVINVLAWSIFMGYSGSITRIIQLARPATFAVLSTVVILGGLSFFRFWLEGQGLHI